MNRLPKWLLTLSVPTFITGMAVSISRAALAPAWTVALPAGVILFGLFMISWLLQDEVAGFDAEERRKIGPAPSRGSAVSDLDANDARPVPSHTAAAAAHRS